jgi:hypothetical protein
VLLTVVVNVWLRLFPGAGARLARFLAESIPRSTDAVPRADRRVRMFVPWKAMILASLLLTLVINIVLWIR